MKKIAITGANGFVGSSLTKKLMSDGFSVICLVRPQSDTRLLPDDAVIKKVDYNDEDQVIKALSGCRLLIHNAAITRGRNWEDFLKFNVDLTGKMVEIAHKISLEKFIFISSQAASGPAESAAKPVKETDICQPISQYGKSKLLAENIVINSKIPYTIIRPVSVFGAGDKDFLNYFKLIKKHLAFLAGFKPKYLNMIHIDDLIELIELTVNNSESENEVFFASSYSLTTKGLALSIKKIMKRSALLIPIPHLLLDVIAFLADLYSEITQRTALLNKQKVKEMKQRYWLVDNTKSQKILGFEPSDDIMNKLQKTYEWYVKEGAI